MKKLNLKLALIFLFYCMFTSNLNAQKMENLLDSCITKSIMLYDSFNNSKREEFAQFNGDSIVVSNGFDFLNLKPVDDTTLNEQKLFKTHYKNGIVECVEFYDTIKKYNYKLKIYDEEKFTYLFGYLWCAGYPIQGVLVVDKDRFEKKVFYNSAGEIDVKIIKQKLYFICLDGKYSDHTYASLYERIEYIMNLDENLLQIYKIAFHQEEIIKYITIRSDRYVQPKYLKEPNEELIYIPWQSNRFPFPIKTFKELDKASSFTSMKHLGSVVPEDVPTYIFPVWLFGDYKYGCPK